MSTRYWIVYECGMFDPEGPFSDIHMARELAVSDASDNGCRVQIHRGPTLEDCYWDSHSTLIEDW